MNAYGESRRYGRHLRPQQSHCRTRKRIPHEEECIYHQRHGGSGNRQDHIPGTAHETYEIQIYVIEGDIESDIDTERLRKENVTAAQINTFGACHLDAPLVHNAVHTMDFREGGILFIENVGNLVCPAELNIGENIKMLIVSVADGSDKPYKYPLAFEKADIILLNKTDLMPYLDFDEDFFMKGLRHLNKQAPVFKVSGKTGEGYKEAAEWIEEAAGR